MKAEPKQLEIYIDGKLAKRTDFFFGSSLVENLLPKKYKIQIKKEGYLSWEKNLEIREKGVTEVKNLVLFPKNLNFTILTKGIENLWFSPDGKKIILEETGEQGWALKLYDLEKNIKSHLIQEVDVYSKGADLMNLEFSEDSKEIYLDIAMKEQKKTFALALDKLPLILKEREPEKIPLENIITYQKLNGEVYYLDNQGFLFKNEEKLTKKSFPVKPETKYEIKTFSNFIFLRENNDLYLLNTESKSFEKFFDRITDLKISSDNKKLAFFTSSEIWILYLMAEGTKKAGEKLFLVRLSEKIDNLFWLNSDYLIFNSGDKIEIVEIDDRDRIQTWDTASFPYPEIYFNRNNRKLYVLSEKNLFVSEKLF